MPNVIADTSPIQYLYQTNLYQISKFLTDIELLKSKTIPSNTR